MHDSELGAFSQIGEGLNLVPRVFIPYFAGLSLGTGVEYKYEFSNPAHMLQIITCHANLVPRTSFSKGLAKLGNIVAETLFPVIFL